MELLSNDRLSKAITLKTQVLPVPDLAWEIRSKTQHSQSYNLTQLVLWSTTLSISSDSRINQVTHLKYVIQSITATLKFISVFATVIKFLPNTKAEKEIWEIYYSSIMCVRITIFLSPQSFQSPVLILYKIQYLSTTGAQSVYQAFNTE